MKNSESRIEQQEELSVDLSKEEAGVDMNSNSLMELEQYTMGDIDFESTDNDQIRNSLSKNPSEPNDIFKGLNVSYIRLSEVE